MFSEQSPWIFALLHHQQCDSTRKPRQTPRHPTNRIPVDVGYLQRSAYKASFSLHTQTRDQSVQQHREERHCYKKRNFATNMVSSNEAHSQHCSVEEDPLARCPLSANLAILGAGTRGSSLHKSNARKHCVALHRTPSTLAWRSAPTTRAPLTAVERVGLARVSFSVTAAAVKRHKRDDLRGQLFPVHPWSRQPQGTYLRQVKERARRARQARTHVALNG
jgi:hypothetical protein